MSIKVHMLTLGVVQTNCFVVADTRTGAALVIDPADNAPAILEVIEDGGYTVREILATHSHFDHVLAARPLKEATGAPFRLHAEALPMLALSQQLAARYGLPAPEPAEPDDTLAVGEIIEVDGIQLETRFTPGHAPGHVSFVMAGEQLVFGGDCLFASGIGRTDLPGADYATLMDSITNQLLSLDDDYQVLAGHGPPTTIGHERANNPFILQWLADQTDINT